MSKSSPPENSIWTKIWMIQNLILEFFFRMYYFGHLALQKQVSLEA